MTDFTNIRTALDNLLAVLDSATADLVGTANEQRRELLALYGRMQVTNADLHEFGSMVGEVGTAMLDIEDLCEDVAAKVQNVLEGGADEVPMCKYEEFIGFCETCGSAILEGEEYSINGDNGFVCADCFDADEQISIDLAETVEPAPATDNQ